ncbi:MAG: UbiA family prenyltransferase, partial [Verrucomicrobiae bacterium]|nr:UbiA family prenyltransferase [Verrucomicrobiae bacterium]
MTTCKARKNGWRNRQGFSLVDLGLCFAAVAPVAYNVAHVVKTAANKEVTIAATLRAWGQLVRLPMLSTALADPLAGWWVSGQQLPLASLALVLVASVCLYAAGMVWNDWFDYRLDCRERPERPLPQGAISRRNAALVAGLLMVTG